MPKEEDFVRGAFLGIRGLKSASIAAGTAGKTANIVGKGLISNKTIVPAAILVDTIQVGSAIRRDIEEGSVKNTIKTGASVAAG